MRLEFLIKQNYPELVSELKECSDWIDDQSRTNPYYAGPINVCFVPYVFIVMCPK